MNKIKQYLTFKKFKEDVCSTCTRYVKGKDQCSCTIIYFSTRGFINYYNMCTPKKITSWYKKTKYYRILNEGFCKDYKQN